MILKSLSILILLLVPQAPAPLDGIPGVVAKGESVRLVREGFVFTEGPVPMADGGLYFSDLLTADRIYRLEPDGDLVVFQEKTNGANGLAVMRTGEVVAVESTGKRVVRIANGQTIVLTEGSPGKPLLSPNDLILDSRGGVYFTDPGPRPAVPGRKVFVYYLPAGAKQPILLDDQIARPNGIIITNDGRTLLVDDTVGDTVFAWDIQVDGTVRNKRPFTKLVGIPAGQNSGADGMAVDREDRLYVTSATGVQVFDKSGRYLATIPVPRQPSNVAFSDTDKRSLYITAREGLYRLRMLSQGPDRAGK